MEYLDKILNSPIANILSIPILFIIIAIFKWLWNITMPQLFDLKRITFWQALRLIVISSIILGVYGICFKCNFDDYKNQRTIPESGCIKEYRK